MSSRKRTSTEQNVKPASNKATVDPKRARLKQEDVAKLSPSDGMSVIGHAVCIKDTEGMFRIGIVKFYSPKWDRYFIHLLHRIAEVTGFAEPPQSAYDACEIIDRLNDTVKLDGGLLKFSKNAFDRVWLDAKAADTIILTSTPLWTRPPAESQMMTKPKQDSKGNWVTCKECTYLVEDKSLTCAVCTGVFHDDCLLPFEKLSPPGLPTVTADTSEFICFDCRSCRYCCTDLQTPLTFTTTPPQVPEPVVVCQGCNLASHGCCVLPRVNRLPAGSQWRCDDCRSCQSCGKQTALNPKTSLPGGDEEWSITYAQCKKCWEGADKGEYCPVCLKAWSVNWGDEGMVQCDNCEFWVHSKCDDLRENFSLLEDQKTRYYCPICRDSSDKSRTRRVLDLLQGHDKHRLFSEAPNPSFLPVYLRVIKNPMDLAKMREKEYSDISDFIADFELIVINAKTFNMPNTPAYKLAEHFHKTGRVLIQKYLFKSKAGFGKIAEAGDSREASPYHRHLDHPSRVSKKKQNQASRQVVWKLPVSAERAESVETLCKLFGFSCDYFLKAPYAAFPFSPCGALAFSLIPVSSQLFSTESQRLAAEGRWVFYECCAGCGSVGEAGAMSACRVCGESFHASCAGVLRPSQNFVCGACTRCRFCQLYLVDDARSGYPKGPSVKCGGCGDGWHPACRPDSLMDFGVESIPLCETCVEVQAKASSVTCASCNTASGERRSFITCLVCGRACHSRCSGDWKDVTVDAVGLDICSTCVQLSPAPSAGIKPGDPASHVLHSIVDRFRLTRNMHFRKAEENALAEAMTECMPECSLSEPKKIIALFQSFNYVSTVNKDEVLTHPVTEAERRWIVWAFENREQLFTSIRSSRRRTDDGRDDEDLIFACKLRAAYEYINSAAAGGATWTAEVENIHIPPVVKLEMRATFRDWWTSTDPVARLFNLWQSRMGDAAFTGLGSPLALHPSLACPAPAGAQCPEWDEWRCCALCSKAGDHFILGLLLPAGPSVWFHKECVLWSLSITLPARRASGPAARPPTQRRESRRLAQARTGMREEAVQLVKTAVACNLCEKPGASVKCVCGAVTAHLPCALRCDEYSVDPRKRRLFCSVCKTPQQPLKPAETPVILNLSSSDMGTSAVEILKDIRDCPLTLAVETDEDKLLEIPRDAGVRCGSLTILSFGDWPGHQGDLQVYPAGYCAVRLFWGVEAGRARQAYICRILPDAATIQLVQGKIVALGRTVSEAWAEFKYLLPTRLTDSLSDLSGDWFFGLESVIVARRARHLALDRFRQLARASRAAWLPAEETRLCVFAALGLGQEAEPLRSWRAVLSERSEQECKIEELGPVRDQTVSMYLDEAMIVSEPVAGGDGKITRVKTGAVKLKSTSVDGLPLSMQYRLRSAIPDADLLVVRSSRIHANGLFAVQPFRKGDMVVEYIGDVVRQSVADLREKKSEEDCEGAQGSCYMFRLDDEFVVDATTRGNCARFINHCCQPNCSCRVFECENHKKHIMIFARTDIGIGEELTYDYQFAVESEKLECSCGAPNCLGRLN